MPPVFAPTTRSGINVPTSANDGEDLAAGILAMANEFDQAPPAWQTLALTGFVGGEALSYYKDSHEITHFKGNSHVVGGSNIAASGILLNLPSGYRPGATIYMPIFRIDTVQITWAALTAAGVLSCSPSGLVASSMVSFGPVAFRAEN
jgi:hypothetical protein